MTTLSKNLNLLLVVLTIVIANTAHAWTVATHAKSVKQVWNDLYGGKNPNHYFTKKVDDNTLTNPIKNSKKKKEDDVSLLVQPNIEKSTGIKLNLTHSNNDKLVIKYRFDGKTEHSFEFPISLSNVHAVKFSQATRHGDNLNYRLLITKKDGSTEEVIGRLNKNGPPVQKDTPSVINEDTSLPSNEALRSSRNGEK